MELVNKDYVYLSKFDIFDNMNKAFEKKELDMYNYFQNLTDNLFRYEKYNKFVDSLYIPVSEISNIKVLISRQTILNAYLYSNINKDFLISTDLEKFLSKRYISCEELGSLSDYVLMHGMDINEYYDGEIKRLIYMDNAFQYDFIYKDKEKVLKK
ncbi:MAG: hypothetical protein J6G98_02810 [Bacilli bacterium]|nr:hypothetical protein [Bacilli bacterium]